MRYLLATREEIMDKFNEARKAIIAGLTALSVYAAAEVADQELAVLIVGLIGAVIVYLTPNQVPQ